MEATTTELTTLPDGSLSSSSPTSPAAAADVSTTYDDRPSFNPSITEDLESDIEKIKGDAIGDTLYSSRFVLNTLLKLTKFNETTIDSKLSDDEQFEKDLCYLWDMTIEKDVVHLLLDHDVLEVFAGIIRASSDERLVEILVGIIGNMCTLQKTRNILCNNGPVMAPLLELISCTDSLVLMQLMRLLHTALVFENAGDELVWFDHFRNIEDFVERFAFILSNSMSTSLLMAAFEALNAMCNKFAVIEIMPDVKDTCFRDAFVTSKLVQGIVEAFKQMLPEIDADETAPTERTHKIMTLFLDINDTLTQYEQVSRVAYEPWLDDFLQSVAKVLTPLCRLFPITVVEQGYIETVNELFQSLGDHFEGECFAQMTRIWSAIDVNGRTSSQIKNDTTDEWNDDHDEDEQVHADDVQMSILDFITRVSKHASAEVIALAVRSLDVQCVRSVYEALSAGDSEPDIEECCAKLKTVLNSVWQIVV